MAEEKEKGVKWWIRYVFVPLAVALIGGGGLFSIAVAVIPYIFATPTPTQVIQVVTAIPTEQTNLPIIVTPTVIFVSPPTLTSAPPTLSPSPLPPTCQTIHLGAGKQFSVRLQSNCYYHFNIACNGCVAGQENNYLVYYVGNPVQVTVPEGSVWQYGTEPTAEQFSSDCAASSIDFWSSQLPSFLNISGIKQLFPCGVR